MESTGIKQKILEATENDACAHHIYPNSAGLRKFLVEELSNSGKVRIIGKGSSIIDTVFSAALKNWKSRPSPCEYDVQPDDVVFSLWEE
jgi:hypothetical protein